MDGKTCGLGSYPPAETHPPISLDERTFYGYTIQCTFEMYHLFVVLIYLHQKVPAYHLS